MESDPKFQGGGTPIGSIIQQPQPHQNLPPQFSPQISYQENNSYQPSPQISYQHSPQISYQPSPQEPPRVYSQRSPNEYPSNQMPFQKSRENVNNDSDKFKDTMGMSLTQFIILIALIIVINSPFVIDIEKRILPTSMRIGDPPFLIIIFNAIIITLLYVGINKLKFISA